VKAVRKRSGTPTSVTPLSVQVGSLTATSATAIAAKGQLYGMAINIHAGYGIAVDARIQNLG